MLFVSRHRPERELGRRAVQRTPRHGGRPGVLPLREGGHWSAPDRVTTDGHDSYPRAIRTELGKGVRHRTSAYLNNRLEQDHRGIKGRYRSMRGFKCPRSASRFCRAYDELRNFLRLRSRHHQHVPADRQRLLHLRRTATVLAILEAA